MWLVSCLIVCAYRYSMQKYLSKCFRADTIKQQRPQMTGSHITKCTKKDIQWPAMPRQGLWPQMQFKAGEIEDLPNAVDCQFDNHIYIRIHTCQNREHWMQPMPGHIKDYHPEKMMAKDTTGCIDQWQQSRPQVQTKARFNWWPVNLVDTLPKWLV